MQYKINYEENITKISSVTIEVSSEAEGDTVFEKLVSKKKACYGRPSDIVAALYDLGAVIVSTCEGFEEGICELMDGEADYDSE